MQNGCDLFLQYVPGYVVDLFGKSPRCGVSRYSWVITEWIWQGGEKTKVNIGTFFGLCSLVIPKERGEEGELAVGCEATQQC